MCNSTFIIPLKIDSTERLNNILVSLNYLLKNTDSNIVITESDSERKLFSPLLKQERIKYIFKKSSPDEFHRTKLINEMLFDIKTDITVNYDADVLLPKESISLANKLILNDNYDLIYPYGFEQFDQRKLKNGMQSYEVFKNTLNLDDINIEETIVDFCRFGHVQFFKTKSYISGFMENENYKHWCPEDEERGIRFIKLGYKGAWFRGIVFHQEHPPSTLKEPKEISEIYKLHKTLINSNKEELENYYKNQNYIERYFSYANSSN